MDSNPHQNNSEEHKVNPESYEQVGKHDGDDSVQQEPATESNLDMETVFNNGQLIGSIRVQKVTIQVVGGDLTNEDTDAIVNAANEHLAHGGGVAGAIARRAGKQFQKDGYQIVKERGPIPTGSAVEQEAPQNAFHCKWIIHAVGPIYRDGTDNEERDLSDCITKSLEIADGLNPPLTSISFPAVSSGIFGFPKPLCAYVFFETINKYINEHPNTNLRYIRLTNFDEPTVRVFQNELNEFKDRLANPKEMSVINEGGQTPSDIKELVRDFVEELIENVESPKKESNKEAN